MRISLSTFAVLLAYLGGAMSAAVGEIDRRQSISCTAGGTTANPVVLSVDAGVFVSISAESHASNLQQLTVIPARGGLSTVVFSGKGEDVPMPIVSGGSGNGLSIPAQSAEYQLFFVFAFSTNNGGTFGVPIVRCPIVLDAGTLVITTLTSEDAKDNDDNDTIVTVIFNGV